MSRTKSTMMLQLGAQAPEFSLPDALGQLVSRSDYVGKPLLVAFMCNHCPYVRHIEQALALYAKEFIPQGLGMVGINPNDAAQVPQDSPEEMLRVAKRAGYDFAYLVDASQKVSQAYRAACTPDFFLFDNNHKLVYRGQFDGTRPGDDTPATGDDLRRATQAVLRREPPLDNQRPSVGCSIKWLVDQAPAYDHT
jgi:peroxiredoxin